MARVDYAAKRIETKVLYWGPRGAGKFCNLQTIWGKVSKAPLEKSGAAQGFTISLGRIREFETSISLVRVPDRFPDVPRVLDEFLIPGVDGAVFVADSSPAATEANRESLSAFVDALASRGFGWRKIPSVVQLNKRDVAGAAAASRMIADLGAEGQPCVEGVASQGIGVFDTLKEISRLVLMELRKAA